MRKGLCIQKRQCSYPQCLSRPLARKNRCPCTDYLANRFIAYNFCRIHKTLRVTPAMAAGVTDRLWEISDIVKVLEDWEVPPAMWLEFGVARSPATRRYRFRLRGQSADQRALWRASASHRPCAC